MVRSEKLIELGNSWFSAKTILVEHSFDPSPNPRPPRKYHLRAGGGDLRSWILCLVVQLWTQKALPFIGGLIALSIVFNLGKPFQKKRIVGM